VEYSQFTAVSSPRKRSADLTELSTLTLPSPATTAGEGQTSLFVAQLTAFRSAKRMPEPTYEISFGTYGFFYLLLQDGWIGFAIFANIAKFTKALMAISVIYAHSKEPLRELDSERHLLNGSSQRFASESF
jgi:hypothetical protein